jgi:hypothetical protein
VPIVEKALKNQKVSASGDSADPLISTLAILQSSFGAGLAG